MKPRTVLWIDLVTAFVAGAFLYTLLFPQARAAELILHGSSYHFDTAAGYNNQNSGLGWVFDNDLVVGAYENSIQHTSVYAGYIARATKHIGLLAGFVTGYDKMPVQPAAVLIITVPVTKRWLAHFNVVPIDGGVINLALGYRI